MTDQAVKNLIDAVIDVLEWYDTYDCNGEMPPGSIVVFDRLRVALEAVEDD